MARPPPTTRPLDDDEAGVVDVYCRGPILAAAQRVRAWDDSKDFVDTPTRAPARDVLAAWRASPPTDDASTRAFLREWFEPGPPEAPSASSSSSCALRDWTEDGPPFAASIAREDLRSFARSVHALWPSLARAPSSSSSDALAEARAPRDTLIPTPHVSLVPGERFRDTYYWDSYWVVVGLLASGMRDAAEGVARNMLHLVKTRGFVPNGARVYYLNRSQPPVLAAAVLAVVEAHRASSGGDDGDGGDGGGGGGGGGGGEALARDALPLLLAEYEYLTRPERVVRVVGASGTPRAMSRYWANTDAPRPESWREDVALATEECGFDVDSSEAKAMWREIATAAESGHDFSSRWLEDDAADDDDDDGVGSGGVGGDAPPTPASLRSIRTTRIVPADLNGFMLKTESCVSRIARLVGDDVVAETFDARATERASAMRDVCWDDAHGLWRDVVLPRRASDPSLALDEEISYASEGFVRGVYASDYVPLWCGAASLDPKLALECVKSIRSSGLILPGGIASSLRHTGHQWDYPNAWAPLSHVVVEGLDAHGGDEGKKLAREIAVRWVESNATLFRKTGYMHEKYDARTPGERPGGGGEYVPQRGFGWSNGVALAFLEKYCVAVADE